MNRLHDLLMDIKCEVLESDLDQTGRVAIRPLSARVECSGPGRHAVSQTKVEDRPKWGRYAGSANVWRTLLNRQCGAITPDRGPWKTKVRASHVTLESSR